MSLSSPADCAEGQADIDCVEKGRSQQRCHTNSNPVPATTVSQAKWHTIEMDRGLRKRHGRRKRQKDKERGRDGGSVGTTGERDRETERQGEREERVED